MVSFYRKLLRDSASKILDFVFKIFASIDRGFQEQINFMLFYEYKKHILTLYHVKLTVNSCVLALYNYILGKNIK